MSILSTALLSCQMVCKRSMWLPTDLHEPIIRCKLSEITKATISGKTVCLKSIVTCLLSQAAPADVRLILIATKQNEMAVFAGVPHLLMPVITDARKAIEVLQLILTETDNRSGHSTRSMPHIVVIIDDLINLMKKEVGSLIQRLSQRSVATGVHMVMATQHPSMDNIAKLIQDNFPARISFSLASSVDSLTILNIVGTEKLLGDGDMLYVPSDASEPMRLRGCFVHDTEINRVVGFWKDWAAKHFSPESDRIAQEFASLKIN